MNILTIMTTRFGNTGITKVVTNIMENANSSKFKIDYIFPNEPSQKYQDLIQENGGSYFIIHNRNKKPLSYILHLKKIINNNNYDIIHVHGNSHTLALELNVAKFNNIPIRIAHAHSTSTSYSSLHKLLAEPFNSALTYGLAASHDAGMWLFENRDFSILPNGVNIEKFVFDNNERAKIRSELNISNDDILVGHVGMFTVNKNQEYLIKLLKALVQLDSHYKLILIGEGPQQKQCMILARELGLENNIIFYGESDEIQKLYSAMDLFVLPSITEGFGMVLLEAQASNLKCFASNTIPKEVDICNDITFINITNETVGTAKIINQYEKESVDKRLNKNNFKVIYNSKFNISESVNYLHRIYENLVQNKI